MSKYTKLQIALGQALECEPDDEKVTLVLETMAVWFEYALEHIGMNPTVIPCLIRWQFQQGQLLYPDDEGDND
jgi:hypothetical protein